jgi:hypothetical protein
MVNAQVINLFNDTLMAFDGYTVIRDADQLELGREVEESVIQVDVHLWDLIDGSSISVEDIAMTYRVDVDFWTIDIADVSGILTEKHKYVGKVSEHDDVVDMRDFKILEFTVYDDILENTIATLPYEIVISPGSSDFFWYDADANIGDFGHAIYTAPAYEGGVGTTAATDASRVTHRGGITRYLV